MKQVRVVLRVLSVLGFLIACLMPAFAAGQKDAGKAAEGPQTITYWVEFTDKASLEVINTYINASFEKAFPKYKIQMTQTPDYQRQIQTSAAAGALPDVFNQYGPSYIPPLFDGGHVLALDNLAQRYGWDKKIWGWMLDSCRYKGKIICLPTEYESLHLFYNADMFSKRGWKAPASWADAVTLTRAMMDAKIIPFAFGSGGGGGITRHEWWISYALNAYSGNAALYEALTGAKPWTDDVYVGAIDTLNKLWQSGAMMSKQTAAIDHNDALGVWGKQEAAMIMDGTWRIRNVGTFAKDFKWAMAKLPSWRESVKFAWPVGCGEVLCVSAKAKAPEGAAEYANWYFRDPKEIGKWITKLPGIFAPPIDMKPEDFAADSDPLIKDTYMTMIQALKEGNFGYLVWSAFPAKTDKALYENIDAVYLGQMTPKQYMEKVNGIFQEELKGGAVPQQPKPRQ